jgi:hypothetical protein
MKAAYRVSTSLDEDGKSLIELRKYMSRPPGASFLGSRAVETRCSVDGMTDFIKVIIDSSSDITLISEQTVRALVSKPRIVNGQKINLLQVTGSATISGFVTIDLYFYTEEGPVKARVEAYVVKGMTTPFLLGNDFADQYSISVIRNEGTCMLGLGDSGRTLQVHNSISLPLQMEDGTAFKVSVKPLSRGVLPRN